MTKQEAISYLVVMKGENKFVNPYREEALSMAVAALREQEERRWIPVTERLPEIGRKCLIANREIVVRGWLRPDGVWKTGVSSDEIWSKFSLYPPTHWMPLPELPEEE